MSGLKELFKALLHKRQQIKKIESNHVEELFSELEEVHIKKQRINHYIKEVNIKEEIYKQYEALDQEAIGKINRLAQKAREIEEKKQNLKGRLISNNAALNRLSNYEDEIPDLIKEMQIAEKRRRETESHILYLKEERAFLEDERETLLKGYSFLKGVSISLVILMGVSLLVSFVMLQILREKIWFILSGVVLMMVISTTAIILIKEKLEKEIKDNGILQQKAGRFLNKSKIRYFNQTQYLEFQYRKLNVDSVAKLELYYNRYLKNKNNERIYLQMNETLTEIEEEILKILDEKDVALETIGDLTEYFLEPKALGEMKYFEVDKEKTNEQLAALEAYEKELWKEIAVLSEEGKYAEQVKVCIENYTGENMLDKILSLSIK